MYSAIRGDNSLSRVANALIAAIMHQYLVSVTRNAANNDI